MLEQVAFYLKMISYYEQKLQTMKHTLYSSNPENIRKAFELISDNEGHVTKNALLNFFVMNVQPINYKDVVELIWLIGDKQNFTISFDEFHQYITHLMITHQGPSLLHTNQNLSSQLIKLFLQQLRVLREVREKRQLIITSPFFDIDLIFEELSCHQPLITKDSLSYFMKKQNILFSHYDYDYLAFAVFPRIALDLLTLKNSIIFQAFATFRHQPHNREIPSEEISDIEIRQIQYISPIKSDERISLKESSVLEFQVFSEPKQPSPTKSKRYVSQTKKV